MSAGNSCQINRNQTIITRSVARSRDSVNTLEQAFSKEGIKARTEDELMPHIVERITHEVPGINRLLYDFTPKSTGTIELKYITNDEFTYLLPLCVDEHTTTKIIKCINESRNTGKEDYEEIILSVLMEMDNYQKALELLQTKPITEELICDVGINRKSAKYDKPYYKLYTILKKIVLSSENLALELYETTKKLKNNKVGGAWRKYFFNSRARGVISRSGICLNKYTYE